MHVIKLKRIGSVNSSALNPYTGLHEHYNNINPSKTGNYCDIVNGILKEF